MGTCKPFIVRRFGQSGVINCNLRVRYMILRRAQVHDRVMLTVGKGNDQHVDHQCDQFAVVPLSVYCGFFTPARRSDSIQGG